MFRQTGHFPIRICFYRCSMASGSELMSQKRWITPGQSIKVLRYLNLNFLKFIIL
jgi:hypothetical protein